MNDEVKPIYTGGPAFPLNWDKQQEFWGFGLSVRDYFAAQALTGAQVWDAVLNGKNSVLAGGGADKLAETAYAVADAMLKAREPK